MKTLVAIENIKNIIRYWSIDSWKHHQRTGVFTQILIEGLRTEADKLLLEPEALTIIKGNYVHAIIDAAYLHDVGEIGVQNKIWPVSEQPSTVEPGRIHTKICDEILGAFLDKKDAAYNQWLLDVCRHHHERWDGSGYPARLKGIEIPLSARIVAVADGYDTISSGRIGKRSFSHERAARFIKHGIGTWFDPNIGYLFSILEDQIKAAGVMLDRRGNAVDAFEELAAIS